MESAGFLEFLNRNPIDRNNIYKHFGSLKADDPRTKEIIHKIWKLFAKRLLAKDVIYLSALAKANFDLLNLCFNVDKQSLRYTIEDPKVLLDYTTHHKKHWLIGLFETIDNVNVNCFKKPINEKIKLLRLLDLISNYARKYVDIDSLITKANAIDQNLLCQKEICKFWYFCLRQIIFILNLVRFCKRNDARTDDDYQMLIFSSENSVLSMFSEFLDLPSCTGQCAKFLDELRYVPHTENISEEKYTLAYYSILKNVFQLTIPDDVNELEENKSLINDTMHDIQKQLLNIEDYSIQIELLEIIFATCFVKKSHIQSTAITDGFLGNPKNIKIILSILKSTINEIKLAKNYQNESLFIERLADLQEAVMNGLWRLELIINTKKDKCQSNLMYYMLANPQSLIYLSIKHGLFEKAYELTKLYNLESTWTQREIVDNELYHELCLALKNTLATRQHNQLTSNDSLDFIMDEPNQISVSEIVEETFQQTAMKPNDEHEAMLTNNLEKYPFLWLYKGNFVVFMKILDVAIGQIDNRKDTKELLKLTTKYSYGVKHDDNNSPLSRFYFSIKSLFLEINNENTQTLGNILLDPDVPMNIDSYQDNLQFSSTLSQLYTDFCESLSNTRNNPGTLNKDHSSHTTLAVLNKYCMKHIESGSKSRSQQPVINYLEKLYNYLEALSKILYIETDSTALITNDKDTSYFELLFYNRSELMGKLLFEKDLNPTEFEKYFKELKLDFLYHVAGNCFPTINLHIDENVPEEELYHENTLFAPNKAVITYILHRSWLLALILNEIYQVDGVTIDYNSESRLQVFINYLHLPRLSNLKIMYDNNDLIAALQNEINYKKLERFVNQEVDSYEEALRRNAGFISSSRKGIASIWKRLVDLVESIPEVQSAKDKRFSVLRDKLLINWIVEGSLTKQEDSHVHAMKISDRRLRIGLLLDNIKIWPIDFCVKFIRREVSSTSSDNVDEEIIEELNDWLKHIEHVKMVMDVVHVKSWMHFYDFCYYEPKEMIERLLDNQNMNLLIDFLQLNEISDNIIACIDQNLIEQILHLQIDYDTITDLLNILPRDYALDLCEKLLDTVQDLRHLIFIVDYIRQYNGDKMFTNIFLSLKILTILRFNETDKNQFLKLRKEPLSIIEVLIMNTKLEKLDAILEMLKSFIPEVVADESVGLSVAHIDQLLRHYAEKSLEFVVAPNHDSLSESTDIVCSNVESSVSSSRGFIMPERVPLKDEWLRNTDAVTCMCCKTVVFSMFNRRHHCRRCGRIVCATCSKKRMKVSNYGHIQVRVCTDCYQQTFKDQRVITDNLSMCTYFTDVWMLTDDAEQNRIIRDEFIYELAPSVSLCLSLMKCHTKQKQYINFLLRQCITLLTTLVPNEELDPGIDYLLVINMLKSLVTAAKMALDNPGCRSSETAVDEILSQIRLFELLTERDCLHLLSIPRGAVFLDANSMRKLIDKLVLSEQWGLALEISTKAGIDTSGVYPAWAISCLKAGAFTSAREKFSKCFDKVSDHQDTSTTTLIKQMKNAPLLKEIIKILESKREPIDVDILRSMHSHSTSSLYRKSNISTTEKPIFILNKLKNLRFIERGQFPSNNHRLYPDEQRYLEQIFYDECVYYLNRYGDVATLIEFHMKYQEYRKILELILERHLSAETFINIYMECLKYGIVHTLQSHMSQIDSSLNIWKDYLRKICIHLEKQDLLHSLYQLQQYMGDYVRAAMTCIRFYEKDVHSFTSLMTNSGYLMKSEEHLKQTLEQEQWVVVRSRLPGRASNVLLEEKSIANPFLIKKMNAQQIKQHTHTIKMQNIVASYLAQYEIATDDFPQPMSIYKDLWAHSNENHSNTNIKIPTLFNTADQKRHLAVLCIVCGKDISDNGFNLALRIIKEFKLRYTTTFNEAGRYLARAERIDSVMELVDRIRQKIPEMGVDGDNINEVCDEILIVAVVSVTKTGKNQTSLIEELVKLIFDKTVRITAYIHAGHLKHAYFLAAKYKRMGDIRRIMKEAEIFNQQNIKLICQKALQKHAQSGDDANLL